MSGDIENITISVGLGHPQIETAFERIVLTVVSPRSLSSVTVLVNPAVAEYKEHAVDTPEVQVRNFAVVGFTEETKKLFFDFGAESTHSVTLRGKAYEIRFMNFTQKPDRGDYEFMITEQ